MASPRGPQVKTRDPGPSLISFQTSLGFPTPRSFTSATTYSPSPATLRCKLRSGILRTRNPRRRNLILGPIALLWLRRSLICRFRLRSCIWAIGYWLLIFFLKIWSFYLLKSLLFTSSILWRMIGFLLNRTKTILYMGIGSSSWIFYAETVVVLDWVFLDWEFCGFFSCVDHGRWMLTGPWCATVINCFDLLWNVLIWRLVIPLCGLSLRVLAS